MAHVTRRSSSPTAGTEDPFAAGGAVAVAEPEGVEFDGTRIAAAGASEDELVTIADHFHTLSREEQEQVVGWTETSTDEELVTWLAEWRQLRAQDEEADELLDGTVDEVLARVGDDRDLAERTLAAERHVNGDEARAELVEPLEALLAQSPADASEGAGAPDNAETSESDQQSGATADAEPPTS